MDDHAERIDRVPVDQHVEPDEIAAPVLQHVVVERSIAPAHGLKLVEEIEDDFAEREFPIELDALGVEVRHVLVDAAPLRAERHDRADILGGHHNPCLHVRLLDVCDGLAGRHQRWVLDQLHRSVGQIDLVFDRRNGGDELEIEFAAQSLLHDLHVKESEEPGAESESESGRRLRLVVE